MKRILISAMFFAFMLTTINAEAVSMKKVNFSSNGQTIVGNLYLPDSYKQGDKLPGVVVTGAWTTVKEQMPATYAKAMAERGFAVLTFDFRGWGESKGGVQYLENPARKIEDIKAAAAFLAARPEVQGPVNGIGICASSGYMSDAAAGNPDIKAITLVAPWLHDRAMAEAIYGGKEGVANLIKMGREAENSDTPVVMEAASTSNDKALMFNAPYYTETERGLIPEYDNKFNVASWEGWLTYDAQKTADIQDTPVLMVESEAAALPAGAKAYAERMGKNVEIIWLDDVSQFDFYDRPEAVKASADAAAEHFSACR
ncbi:alpha/beta hydrolase [Maridesulfovibrio sp.]|uniref:alpha/beta hydrolase n=1 Tax=Maridesulfovibrio sp. TaxID=2795000 RepID=UPI003BA957A6